MRCSCESLLQALFEGVNYRFERVAFSRRQIFLLVFGEDDQQVTASELFKVDVTDANGAAFALIRKVESKFAQASRAGYDDAGFRVSQQNLFKPPRVIIVKAQVAPCLQKLLAVNKHALNLVRKEHPATNLQRDRPPESSGRRLLLRRNREVAVGAERSVAVYNKITCVALRRVQRDNRFDVSARAREGFIDVKSRRTNVARARRLSRRD